MRRISRSVHRVAPTYNVRHASMTCRDALNLAMDHMLASDSSVFVMGEEVAQFDGAYKITRGLHDKYNPDWGNKERRVNESGEEFTVVTGPQRVQDTPITEMGFTGLACGAGLAGLKPVVEFMTWNFAMQGIDHIVNSAAKGLYMSGGQLKCPITFRGGNGASAGVGAQHSQCFAAWYSSIPGLKCVTPYSAEDCLGLLKASIRDPNPVVFLENEMMYGQEMELPDECLSNIEWDLPLGKAKVEREGTDLTIVAFSKPVKYALAAADKLQEQGISVEVVNLRTLRPLDRPTILNSVMKTGRLLTVEEGWLQSGVTAEIMSTVVESDAFDFLHTRPVRVTGAEIPLPYSKALEPFGLPSEDDVLAAAKRMFLL
eukprot:NODE_1585_length_1286_cov_219.786022_g1570_i0.p1 GENE.NODE_1585_length_1286_cov_219.786022_g1570_i0~~NODE_1585_length_1286_cov_219.786022_g1570_i0.p1  ORF type:complete len:372 (+),score=98.20 NODE_1585_length_1286_cov_219.786022_g1570_i0:73-1188(+)